MEFRRPDESVTVLARGGRETKPVPPSVPRTLRPVGAHGEGPIDRDSMRFAFREAMVAGMPLSLPRSPVHGTFSRVARFEISSHENAGKCILVRSRRPENRVRHCLS
jgi:hypothetical protein